MRPLFRTVLLVSFSFLLIGVAHGQTPTTTIQNGNDETRLQLNHDGGLVIPGTFGSMTPADSIPAAGAGTRLMWYPAKAAFRAGRVFDNSAFGAGVDGRTFWDPANVGNYSVAFGNNTTASGNVSFASGINTLASGASATTFGAGTEANERASTAMGEETRATGEAATAMGLGSEATGKVSTAMGNGTSASGGDAVAMGRGTVASNFQTTAMGAGTRASGIAATAMGIETIARRDAATAMGDQTTASGFTSTAMGLNTTASGSNATAMGNATTASGTNTTTMGIGTTAASNASLSTGECNSSNASEDNTLLAVGNGDYNLFDDACDSRSDALVVDASGNLEISGGLTESSDRRLKTDVVPLSDGALSALREIRPVRYQFKNQETHPSGEQIGLVAQDVRKEFPALVSGGAGDVLSLSYSKFSAVLLKGLQEQQSEIDRQQSEINALQAENEAIQKRLDRLEQNEQPVHAGVVGPWGLLVLLVCAMGGIGGLLWARRPPSSMQARSQPNRG